MTLEKEENFLHLAACNRGLDLMEEVKKVADLKDQVSWPNWRVEGGEGSAQLCPEGEEESVNWVSMVWPFLFVCLIYLFIFGCVGSSFLCEGFL